MRCSNIISLYVSHACLGPIVPHGIGYDAVSDNFEGFNVAISDPSLLKCVEVERWLINKINNDEFEYMLIEKGRILNDGSISWLSDT
jgi:hypothetical protein